MEHAVDQGCQTNFHQGHISLTVAFKGPNVILGLYKHNYSLSVKRELSMGMDRTRWRARFSPWALCLPPVQ